MSYENTTHKVNLTGGEISTILYHLDGAFNNISEDIHPPEIQRIYAELQSVTDNYYAQLESQSDNNYAECVDQLVNSMGEN